MADEIRAGAQPLPPIASSLVNMHSYLRQALAGGATRIATGPLHQQAQHIEAVISEVAAVERELEDVRRELGRLRPAESFLKVCRELHREVLAVRELAEGLTDGDRALGALESIREAMMEIMTTHGERDDFLEIAGLAIDAVMVLDAQAAVQEEAADIAQEMEAAGGGR